MTHKHTRSAHTNILARAHTIAKTCLYNFDPLKPHFYIVKLGFTWVYTIFLISAQKHRLWVLVRSVPTISVLNRNRKKYQVVFFLSEIFSFLYVKFSIHLNRRVFVMHTTSIQERTKVSTPRKFKINEHPIPTSKKC